VVCDGGGSEGSGFSSEDVLPLLAALQDQSLILLEEGEEEERYRMLEPLRQFAAEKLAEREETDATRQRHAEFFLALAEAAQPELERTGSAYWLDRLERDRDNLRAARDWFEADDEGAGQSIRLASALKYFGMVREHRAEARARLERALSRPSEPSPARVRVLFEAGEEAMNDGELALAQRRFEEAQAIAQELGDRRTIADALTYLGRLAAARQEDDRALTLFEASLAIKSALGDKQGVVHNLVGLGDLADRRGDLATARAYFEECRFLDRELGVKGGWALWRLGQLAMAAGDAAAAREPWETLLRASIESGHPWDRARGLAGCARVAAAGEPERAARLWGAAVAVLTSLGGSLATCDWAYLEPDVLAAGAVLGEAGLAAALAEGGALPVDEAVAYALGERPLPAVRS
jgi:tetratricopeptide (TPR) repeat protein